MSLSDELLIIRMQLMGARQVAADAQVAAGGIREVGAADATAGKEAEFAAEKQFLFGQSLYSLRRYLFYGTTAVGAFAYGIGKLGLQFDDARTVGVTTFTAILGSNRAANDEMDRLIRLTHQSGLQLTDLEQGAQQLLTFGFGAKTATNYLTDMAIAAQRLHQGVGGLQTFIGVFSRIRDQGQLTGRTLLQLIRDGVPALQILQKQLHLTPLQLSMVEHGQLVVPARYALPALAAGMRNLPGTFSLGAQFGQFKSYAGQLFGLLLQPLFNGLSRKGGLLSRVDTRLGAASSAYQKGGTMPMLNALDPSGTLAHGWTILSNIVKGTVSVFHAVYTAARPFLPLLTALATLFSSLASHGTLVNAVLYAMAARYAYTRTTSLLFLATNKLVGGGLYDLLGVTAKSSATAKLYALWMGRSTIAQATFGRALTLTRMPLAFLQRGLALGYNSLTLLRRGGIAAITMLRGMAVALGLVDAELMLTPVGWIAIGAVAAAVLGILIWKVGAVRGAFSLAGHAIGGIFTTAFHAVAAGISWIVNALKGTLRFVYNIFAAIANAMINAGTLGFGGILAGHGYGGSVVPYIGRGNQSGIPGRSAHGIPFLARGGNVSRGGLSVVGDAGPELLNLPTGARVTPLRRNGVAGTGSLAAAIAAALANVQIAAAPVNMDGRAVAEIVFGWEQRLEALS